MKGKKVLALLCTGLMAVSLFAGCGSKKTDNADTDTKTEAKGDVSEPAGYYQWTYEVDGMGTWVNYIHLYEESSIGNVYYLGIASNQITQAGTYEVVKEKCDYEVSFERAAEGEETEMKKGSTDYTIVFSNFAGEEVGRCAYDGTYIYNDTDNVCGTGCEDVRMTKDEEGLDGKSGQADSGYKGEVGIAYLKAVSTADETCTVALNHDGTYADLIGEYEVDGTWKMADDKKTYTLTPDDSSDTGATVVVNEAGDGATYTPEGGAAVELTIDVSKPKALDFVGVSPSDMGMDINVEIACYSDKTCDLIISLGTAQMPMDAGTYAVADDGTITVTLEKMGELKTNADLTFEGVEVDASAYSLGTLKADLAKQ